MINNFSIFKSPEKKNDKAPDYRISTNVGTKEQPQYVEIGGGWIKEGQKGKFISCQLSKAFGDKKGYELVESKEDVNIPKFDRDSKGKEIDPQDIPF